MTSRHLKERDDWQEKRGQKHIQEERPSSHSNWSDSQEQHKESLPQLVFADISSVQIISSALAALTSFMLTSKIGIAGSIIGVVVASIASNIAVQVYRNVLTHSAQRIRDRSSEALRTQASARVRTTELHDQELNQTKWQPAATTNSAQATARDDTHMKTQRKRWAIAIAIIVTLVTVALYAVVVLISTRGYGIGTRWSPSEGVITRAPDWSAPKLPGSNDKQTDDQAPDQAQDQNDTTDSGDANDANSSVQKPQDEQQKPGQDTTTPNDGKKPDTPTTDQTDNSGSSPDSSSPDNNTTEKPGVSSPTNPTTGAGAGSEAR